MFPTFYCVCLFFSFGYCFVIWVVRNVKESCFFFLFEKKLISTTIFRYIIGNKVWKYPSNSRMKQKWNHFVKKKIKDKLLVFFSFFESKIYTCTCIKNKSIDLISISNPVKITKGWNKIFVELDPDPTVKKEHDHECIKGLRIFFFCAQLHMIVNIVFNIAAYLSSTV